MSGKPTGKMSLSSGESVSQISTIETPGTPPLRWLHKLCARRTLQLLEAVPMLPRSIGGCKREEQHQNPRSDVSEKRHPRQHIGIISVRGRADNYGNDNLRDVCQAGADDKNRKRRDPAARNSRSLAFVAARSS